MLFFLYLSPAFALASGNTFSISTDNDGIIGTDQEYSSGLFIRFSKKTGKTGYSAELGSQIWTPSDIEQILPQPNERPYTGLASLQLGYHYQSDSYANKLGFMLGKIGPDSHADLGQKVIHSLIGSPEPDGWAYQTSNKIVYQISAENHLLFKRNSYGEFSGFARGQIGNFQPEAALGLTYRLGIDLDNTFGATSNVKANHIDPNMLYNSPEGVFFYLSTEAVYRFKDITIEGDTPSAPVEIAPLTVKHTHFALSSGIAWYKPTWGLTLSLTTRSATYQEAKNTHHTYGNISYFYRF